MSIWKNIAFALGGSVASRIIQFTTIIISARFLSPAEFAVWPLFLIIAQIPAVIGMLRLDIAITIARSEASAIMLARMTLLFTLVVAALTTLGALLLYRLEPDLLGFALTLGLLPMIFLHIVASNLTTVQQAFLTRKRLFRSFAIQSVVATGSTFALILTLQALFGLTAFLFILSQVVGLALGVAVGLYNTREVFLRRWQPGALRDRGPALLRRYRAYPLLYTPYSLSQSAQERLVNFLVASAFGLAALGKFFLVRQLFVATANLFAQPLRQLLFSYLVGPADRRQQAAVLSGVLALVLAVTAPLIFLVPPLLQPVLLALAGDEWRGLESAMFWMAWIAWVIVGVAWIDRVFDVVWKQKTAVTLQLVSDALILAALAAAVALALPFVAFVAIYSVMTAGYYLLWSSLALHSFHPGWSTALRPPLGAGIGIGCGVAGLLIVRQLPEPTLPVLCLIFAGASAIAALVTARLCNVQISDFFLRK